MRVGEFKISSISLISKNSQNTLCEFKYDFNIEFNSSKKKPKIEKKNQITGQFKQKIKEHDNSNRKFKRISMKLTKY